MQKNYSFTFVKSKRNILLEYKNKRIILLQNFAP